MTVIDNRTSNLNLPLPSAGNTLDVDVSRLQDAINGIDSAVTSRVSQTSASGAAKLPVGTTSQRPTGAAGNIRFNSDKDSFEGFKSDGWGNIGGGGYASKTVTENTVLASNAELFTGASFEISATATLEIPDTTRLSVSAYPVGLTF